MFGHFCTVHGLEETGLREGLKALASWKGLLSRGRAAHVGQEETPKTNTAL